MSVPGIAVPGLVVPSGSLANPGGPQGFQGLTGARGTSAPGGVSTDAGNLATLGSDSRIYVPSQIGGFSANGYASGINQRLQLHDDFRYPLSAVTASTVIAVWPMPWSIYISGSGGQVIASYSGGQDVYNKCYGVFAANTGAVSGNLCILTPPAATLVAGLGQLDLYFRIAFAIPPTTSSPGSFLSYYFGLSDTVTSVTNNSIYISGIYNGPLGAVGWQGSCYNSGTRTIAGPQANPAIVGFSSAAFSYYNIHIAVNTTWTSVTFFVNGVQIGNPVTAHIVAAGTLLYIIVFTGTSASGQASILIDDIFVDYQYALP